MNLQPINEPAGTLLTGWKLVTKEGRKVHAEVHAEKAPAPAGDTGRWTVADPRSAWEMGEVG
jgi:hypothetical protein